MLFNLNEQPMVSSNFTRRYLIEELTGVKDSVFNPDLNTEDEAPEEGENPFVESYLTTALRSVNESIISEGDEWLVEQLKNTIEMALAETEDQFNVNSLQEATTEIALNEAMVFAKSKTLLLVEAKLDEIIKLSREIPIKVIELRKITVEVGQLLGDYFGFGQLLIDMPFVSIHPGGPNKVSLQNMFGMSNAFTFKNDFMTTVQHQVNDRAAYITANGRISWSKDVNPYAVVTVTQGVIHSPGVEGRHVLAAILHELGHSFYHGSITSRIMGVMASPIRAIMIALYTAQKWVVDVGLGALAKNSVTAYGVNLLYTLVGYMSVAMLLVGKEANIEAFFRTPQVRRMLGGYAEITDTFMNAKGLMRAVNKFSTLISYLHLMNFGRFAVKNASTLIQRALSLASMDYTGEEKFADEFAATHGYGAELNEFLSILVQSRIDTFGQPEHLKNVRRMSVGEIFAVATSYIEDTVGLTDPHPSDSVRPLNIVDFYRRQLATASTNAEKEYISKELTRAIKSTSIYRSVGLRETDRLKIENDLKTKTLASAIASYVPLPAVAVKEIFTYNGGNVAALEAALRKKGVKITTK